MSNLDLPPPEERFKDVVIEFSDLIYELVSDLNDKVNKMPVNERIEVINPNLVLIAKNILGSQDSYKIINVFIKRSSTHWDEIFQKKEKYFLEDSNDIFGDLPIKINAFKELMTAVDKNGNRLIPAEDREAIWDFLHSLVKIAINYIHEKRDPIGIKSGTEIKLHYQISFYPHIQLEHHAKVWGINLEFPVEEE